MGFGRWRGFVACVLGLVSAYTMLVWLVSGFALYMREFPDWPWSEGVQVFFILGCGLVASLVGTGVFRMVGGERDGLEN